MYIYICLEWNITIEKYLCHSIVRRHSVHYAVAKVGPRVTFDLHLAHNVAWCEKVLVQVRVGVAQLRGGHTVADRPVLPLDVDRRAHQHGLGA